MNRILLGFVSVIALTTGVHATTNGTNATNGTNTTTVAPVGLCVNVTTPTNVTSNVTHTNTTDNTTYVTETLVLTDVTECVACENVTTLKNVTVTTTNSTDNSTSNTTTLQNVTECVPIVPYPTTTSTTTTTTASPTTTSTTTADPTAGKDGKTTKISGSLDVAFTVPKGVTAAALNKNGNFKSALAKTIKKALKLKDTAKVVIKKIKAAGRRSLNAGRRALKAEVRSLTRKVQRSLASESLKLEISYEITLPKKDAEGVFKKIADKDTFEKEVKSKSVAELSSAGFTGYTVDSVTASDAEGDLKPKEKKKKEKTSGAYGSFGKVGFFGGKGSAAMLANFLFLVGGTFSLKMLA